VFDTATKQEQEIIMKYCSYFFDIIKVITWRLITIS
jgi:hypothetical protein